MSRRTAGTRSSGSRTADGRWVSETRDERFAGVAEVRITVAAGRIEIGSRRRPDVRIRTTLVRSGWRARLAALRPPPVPGATLRRPADHAPAAPGTTGGDVVVLDHDEPADVRVQVDVPAGLRVRAAVVDGDVTLWGVAGDLTLSVGRGVLAGRDLGPGTVHADNEGGEVNLHFRIAPAAADVMSGPGPALLVLPAGTYRVDADPEAEVTVDRNRSAESSIRVRSGGRSAVLAATGSEPI